MDDSVGKNLGKIAFNLAASYIDLAILASLRGAGTQGLPLQLIAKITAELVYLDKEEAKKKERSLIVSVFTRLKAWKEEDGFVYQRNAPPNHKFPGMPRATTGVYCLDEKGAKHLEQLLSLQRELNQRLQEFQDYDSLFEYLRKESE